MTSPPASKALGEHEIAALRQRVFAVIDIEMLRLTNRVTALDDGVRDEIAVVLAQSTELLLGELMARVAAQCDDPAGRGFVRSFATLFDIDG